MSHIKITVDGKTLMDADPGTWRHTPPDIPDLRRQSGGQPWGLAVMGAVAQTATLTQMGRDVGDTTMTITTGAQGWTMDVQHEGGEPSGVPAKVMPTPSAPPAHAAAAAPDAVHAEARP
ncbi:MFS transporter [Mycobacteroides abscessus]